MQRKKLMLTGGWKGLGAGTGEVELPVIKHETQHGPRLGLGWAAAPQFPSQCLGQALRRKTSTTQRAVDKGESTSREEG